MVSRVVSPRDILLLVAGAVSMYLLSAWFLIPDRITVNTHFNQYPIALDHTTSKLSGRATTTVYTTRHATRTIKQFRTATITETVTETVAPEPTNSIDLAPNIPETTIIQHAPGWTVFRNLYMAHGTLYIVTSDRESFPQIRKMSSTGIAFKNNPDNIEDRDATPENMDFLTPEEAKNLWGPDLTIGESFNRIVSVEGNTWLLNDPRQFLHHYYHLVAELLFGAWAIWTGSFTESSYDTVFQYAEVYSPPPKVDRMIFAHSDADGWRDSPGFDAYFLRAAFPSTTIEHAEDWQDRVTMSTTNNSYDDFYSKTHQRAWHFPLILLADRSGAFRGDSCGSRTQRTASEAWEAMITRGQLPGLAVGGWWSPIRTAVWKFAGVQLDAKLQLASKQAALAEALHVGGPEAMILPMTQLPAPETVVITYISRQAGNRRKLIDEDHDGLVSALQELVARKGKGWEFQLLEAEKMTKDSQVRAVSRSTIMLGVHGNGLTHLVLMPPSRLSTVIEIFYPGGFAHDYQWTTTALGMTHFSVWNDTYHSNFDKPGVHYPEGFQGTEIPVHGPTVAKLIEDRVEGRL
ncbi:hypothetical protein EYR38_009785 [Pleurotus pulmonarius]|nr:hypothetical protein EYR38_009785 [Pleurotus pulmonarius]